MSTTWTHHRARVANATLRGDTAAADEARRDMRAARLELVIRAALDATPPLTDDQCHMLAGLLTPDARRADGSVRGDSVSAPISELDLDAIRKQSSLFADAYGSDQAALAHELAARVPELCDEVELLRLKAKHALRPELTGEPGPDVTEVYDHEGHPWERNKAGLWCAFGVGVGVPTSWASLARVWGPITVEATR